MSFRITINDTGLKVKMARLDTVLPQILDDSLNIIGQELEGQKKIEDPVVTSNLEQNIIHEVSKSIMRAGVDGNLAPYGRRVALGFFDTDSLGRTYRQRPNEYHLRALESVRPNIENIVRVAITKATAGL